MNILVFLLVGLLAGWIADNLFGDDSFGLVGNLVVGIIGAFIGGFVLGLFDVDLGGLIGETVTAVIGALILLWIVKMLAPRGAA